MATTATEARAWASGLSDTQIDALNAPLDPAAISTREGKYDYVEGHYCIRKMNAIFGFGNWQRRTLQNEVVMEEEYTNDKGRDGWRVAYRALVEVAVLIDGDWRYYEGTGYGDATIYNDNSHLGAAHESASKEAETDSMKRAMICLGDQFGLALYDNERAHVGEGGGTTQRRPQQQQQAQGDGRSCPDCGKPMALRTRKDGSSQFYGCTGYPGCKHTEPYREAPAGEPEGFQGVPDLPEPPGAPQAQKQPTDHVVQLEDGTWLMVSQHAFERGEERFGWSREEVMAEVVAPAARFVLGEADEEGRIEAGRATWGFKWSGSSVVAMTIMEVGRQGEVPLGELAEMPEEPEPDDCESPSSLREFKLCVERELCGAVEAEELTRLFRAGTVAAFGERGEQYTPDGLTPQEWAPVWDGVLEHLVSEAERAGKE